MRKRKRIEKVLLYSLLICLFLYLVFPFVWTFLSSIKPGRELYTYHLRLVPQHPTFDRYVSIFTGREEVLGQVGVGETIKSFRYGMLNSLLVSISVSLICLVLGSLAAYAFARLKFRGSTSIFLLIMILRLIPVVVLIIPLFLIVGGLNLLDTKTSLMFVYSSFWLPLIILIMKSFFEKMPSELEDSAMMDGCGRIGVLFRIVLPLSIPGLIAALFIAFISTWQEFFLALVVTSSLNSKTLPVIMAEFFGRQGMDYGMLSTGAIIAVLPLVIIALIAQKYIVKGLTMGAVKG